MATKAGEFPAFYYANLFSLIIKEAHNIVLYQDNPVRFSACYGGRGWMNFFDLDDILRRLEQLTARLEVMHLEAYLRYVHDWRRRLFFDFLSGIARGVGFSIGFSVLSALLLYLLRNAALSNLPVLGRFVAELVRIVENNLGTR